MDEYEKKCIGKKRYKDALKTLKKNFGYEKFKPHQYQIIDTILNGEDVISIMPTGYGKSLCFQLPPLISGELAIVVSPLIALMEDQKMILDNLGIASCCYNSTKSKKEKAEMEEKLIEGEYQLMYITPESLVGSRKLIDKIYENQGVCMVAIDEAHCLSSYGFDFRPKYKELAKVKKMMPNVPILAVTATATDKVIRDIKTIMEIGDGLQIKVSFDRPNLNINVKLQNQDTINEIVKIIKETDGPSILYCLTIPDTEAMSKKLEESGISCKPYYSKLKPKVRTETQEEFMNGEFDCIAATIAFGMGINKADIRTVIHYGCPQNIESYYQEIGRAGRDGEDSDCYLFYREKDFRIQKLFIKSIKDPAYKVVREALLRTISQYVNTDGCRRKFILDYFGEKYKKKNCKTCDNCTQEKEEISPEDELKLFQVLSTVAQIRKDMGYSYGMSTVALILKGSNSAKIKKWMKNLPYYGCMSALRSIKEVTKFVHKTIELGYIEQYDAGDCVHVLRCTDRGLEFGADYETVLNDMARKKDKKMGKMPTICI